MEGDVEDVEFLERLYSKKLTININLHLVPYSRPRVSTPTIYSFFLLHFSIPSPSITCPKVDGEKSGEGEKCSVKKERNSR